MHDAQVAAAKQVCAGCPVVAQCLAEALARIPYGIAGGLTEDERRDLVRRPRPIAASAVAGAERSGTAGMGGQAA